MAALIGGVLIGYRRPIHLLLSRLTRVDAVGVAASFVTDADQALEVADQRSDVDGQDATDLTSIKRVTPTSFEDARTIGETYRSGEPVLLDLTSMDNELAKRIVDFSAGLTFQAGGSIEKVADWVFVLGHRSPSPSDTSPKAAASPDPQPTKTSFFS